MKITAMIYVPAIEPSLKFWVDQLGFTKTVEVPDGNKLGFVILMHGNAELMIQSTASVGKDLPAMSALARPAACLYIEVSDFDDLLKRLGSAPVEVPVRTTFYRHERNRRPRARRQHRPFRRASPASRRALIIAKRVEIDPGSHDERCSSSWAFLFGVF